jgi:hypothetical protein
VYSDVPMVAKTAVHWGCNVQLVRHEHMNPFRPPAHDDCGLDTTLIWLAATVPLLKRWPVMPSAECRRTAVGALPQNPVVVVVVGAAVVVVVGAAVVVGLGTAQLCDLSVVATGVPVARRRSHVKRDVPTLTKIPLHSELSVQLEMHAHTNASRSPPHDACDDEVMLIWFAAIRALL